MLRQLIAKNGEPPFDMIFIDADEENPIRTISKLSLKLSRPGTLIAADNVPDPAGRVLDPEAHASDPAVGGVVRFMEALAKMPEHQKHSPAVGWNPGP